MYFNHKLYEKFCRLPPDRQETFSKEIIDLLEDENWIERRKLSYENPDPMRAARWILNREHEQLESL